MSAVRWDRCLTLVDHAVPVRVRASVDDALSVADVWTPADELMATEPDDDQDDPRLLAERDQARRMAVRVRQFILFAEFVSTGVDELDVLKMRSLILLRSCVPQLLLSRYGLTQLQALREERRLWDGLGFWFRQRPYVPLAEALKANIDEDEELCAAVLDTSAHEMRIIRFGEFCTEIARTAGDIDAFAKTTASMLRRVKTEFVSGLGESQAAMSRKFNEQRATVCAREMRAVEAPVKASGQKGFHLLGGTKSEGHREACAKAQKGNTNRSDGQRRRAALDE